MGLIALAYGLVVYAIFLATSLYAVGFVGNLWVPKSIDLGFPAGASPSQPVAAAVLIDLALLGIFAVQHSVMARATFKRWWTHWVPASVERSTYVLMASAALMLLFAQWRPVTTPVWKLPAGAAALALHAVSWMGWVLAIGSTFLIDHLELFGLRQVWLRLTRSSMPTSGFRTPMLYGHVRHPMYLGFLLAFWATPAMTVGHLLFAVASTGYILVGIWFEERDLVALFGQSYRDYRRSTGMLLPRLRRRAGPPDQGMPAAGPGPTRRA